MAEGSLNESFPDLKEVENKVGRKTPESLLMWIRDAADSEDGWRSDVVDRGNRSSALTDCFSDRISNLKQEMKRLRSADVKILRQLVAVHEGIEAMRWLLEERDALPSRDSSLTGSMSSLVTVEENGPSMVTHRENLCYTQDLTEQSGEESEDQPPHTGNEAVSGMLSPESTEANPPCPSTSELEVRHCLPGRPGQACSGPANALVNARLSNAQSRDPAVTPVREAKAGADVIRNALLRSSRTRREVRADAGGFSLNRQSGETQAEHQATLDSFRAPQNNKMEEEESAPSRETALLGYDAQWCWVNSQDDVTFL